MAGSEKYWADALALSPGKQLASMQEKMFASETTDGLMSNNCGFSCHPGCIVECTLRFFISVTSIAIGSDADKKPQRRYPFLPVLIFVNVRESKKCAMQRTHTGHVPHCLLICGTPHVLLPVASRFTDTP